MADRSFVKRIVGLSSAAAILHIPSTFKIFTEDDWNEQSTQLVEKQGKAAGNVVIYMARLWPKKVGCGLVDPSQMFTV
jgi:hypothetical protein